jgi:hypothetical protein
MGAGTKARWCPGRYVPRVFWSLSRARDICVAVRKTDLRRLVELGVMATSNLFRSAGLLLELGVLATSNLFRSAGLRTRARSILFRSSGPVGRSSLFRPTEPRGWVEVILDFSLSAASVLVKSLILEFSVVSLLVNSSKPMDFLERCLS